MKQILTIFLAAAGSAIFSADLTGQLMKQSYVTIPTGEHTISRTVEVSRNLTVILENGAVIKSSVSPMFRIKGGEFRMEGRGLPGKIICTAKGQRGYATTARAAAFDLNYADGKLPLRFFLRNIQVQSWNGVDAYFEMKDRKNIEKIDIAECAFRCHERAIAVRLVGLGSARVENCTFDGGDNPILLNAATPGGVVIRGNTLRNFGRMGMLLGKAGQVSEGCTTHLPDTIVHDNRLIGGGHGASIKDSYIHGILIYGNNVSVQGNIVRDVNRGEPVPGSRIGQQIKLPDGRILRGKWISVNGKRRRLAGAAIYLKANRALVQGNICTNSGWRSVIEIKTGGKEYYTAVLNNVVDGRALAIDESFGFECNSGRSLWSGNLVYDMPHQAFVVRSGYENTFINNLIINAQVGFALSGRMPGQNELISGNRFIDVDHPVAVDGRNMPEGFGPDILLPGTAKINDRDELPEPGPQWHGRQLVRGDKIYLGIRQGKEYRWMELQGKVLEYHPWKPTGPELFRNSDMSGKEQFEDKALNDPRCPGWILGCLSAREQQVPDSERALETDRKVYNTGNASQKVVFPNVAASWSLSRKIKLTPGRHYRATAVVKGEEPRNLRLQATPAGRQAVIARAAEKNSWQTLTVDFFQPDNISDCTISVWGGKTTAGKAAWIDSVSVRELTREGSSPAPRPKVKLIGNNLITAKTVWRVVPASAKVTRQPDGSMQVTAGKNGAVMLTSTLKLKEGAAWRFAAEASARVSCGAVLSDGKKLSADKNSGGQLDFTTPDKSGNTQLRIWIPPMKQGDTVTIKPPTLFQREQK